MPGTYKSSDKFFLQNRTKCSSPLTALQVANQNVYGTNWIAVSASIILHHSPAYNYSPFCHTFL